MDLQMLLMMGALLVVLYFIMVRPENKKKKAAEEMRKALGVGDEITTIGGIVGTICAVKENTIVIEIGADRVRLEITKWAISDRGFQKDEEKDTKKGKKSK